MSLDFSKKYIFDNEFETFERDDRYLYVDFDNVNWFRTNKTGKEIISLCDGERCLDGAISEIAEQYQFDKEFLRKNFESFLADAIENDVLLEEGCEKKRLEASIFGDSINTLWIHVTGVCNLECPFCYSKSGSGQKPELDIDVLLKFMEGIKKEDREQMTIVISGGEPFLYKKLPQLVQAIRAMGFHQIQIISNGTVGEELYCEVIPYIDSLQISVDGSTAEFHDLTRGKGSFDKMINKFSLIKSFGSKAGIYISFTPTKYNINDLPNIPQFAFENKVDAIHLTRLMPVGRGKENMEDISPDTKTYDEKMNEFFMNYQRVNGLINIKRETEEILLDDKDKTRYISLSFAGDQTHKIKFRTKKTVCGMGLGSMSINYDGNVYPCASFHLNEYVFGNINETSLEDIINNAKALMNKCSVDYLPGCSKCKLKYFCGGGCRACGLSCTGDLFGSDPMCDYYKEAMVEVMWHYQTLKEDSVKG